MDELLSQHEKWFPGVGEKVCPLSAVWLIMGIFYSSCMLKTDSKRCIEAEGRQEEGKRNPCDVPLRML